jgi:hypothetical protein
MVGAACAFGRGSPTSCVLGGSVVSFSVTFAAVARDSVVFVSQYRQLSSKIFTSGKRVMQR